MMKTFACLALVATVTFALPDASGVEPPEVSEFEDQTDLLQSYSEAQAELHKSGQNACNDLAGATEKEVEDNVKAEQDLLGKMDRGEDCPKEGQDEVKNANAELAKAKQAQSDADDAHNKARAKKIDFGTFTYSGLTEGNCSPFFGSAAWIDAKNAVNSAKGALDTANGAVAEAEKAVAKAKEDAKAAVTKCQCDVKKKHSEALTAANKKAAKANTEAWTKAAHLKCVIAGTSANNCKVPTLPAVVAVPLAEGVAGADCNAPTTGGGAVANVGQPGKSGCVRGWPLSTVSHSYGRIRISNIPSRAACWARAKSDGYGSTPAISWHCNSNANHGNGDCTSGSKGTCDYWKTVPKGQFTNSKILNTATCCYYWWTCTGGATTGSKKAGTE